MSLNRGFRMSSWWQGILWESRRKTFSFFFFPLFFEGPQAGKHSLNPNCTIIGNKTHCNTCKELVFIRDLAFCTGKVNVVSGEQGYGWAMALAACTSIIQYFLGILFVDTRLQPLGRKYPRNDSQLPRRIFRHNTYEGVIYLTYTTVFASIQPVGCLHYIAACEAW